MLGNEEVQGIYILAASEIFTKLHNESHGKGLGLWISFYEIYCGQLFDLLNGRAKYVCVGNPEKYKLVYIGDLKKMITVQLFVSTTVHVHAWLHGKISVFKINKNRIRSNLVTPWQQQPLSFLVTYRDWSDPGFVDAYDFLKLVHTVTATKMRKQNVSTLLAEIHALAFKPVFCEQRKYTFACSNCLNVNANTSGCSKMSNVPFSVCLHLYLF